MATRKFRAGLAQWRGHPVVLLEGGEDNPSRLSEELRALGAEVSSQGVVTLDGEGRVSLDSSERLPVVLIVAAGFQANKPWKPDVLRGARAVLPLLERVVADSPDLDGLLGTASRLAARVVTLRGAYSDEASAARSILGTLDSLIDDAKLSHGPPTDRPVALFKQAKSTLAGLAAPTEAGEPPQLASDPFLTPEERERLSEQNFILLLHWHGRFGNRMHQYAYGATYTKMHVCHFWLPSDWEGTHLFQTQQHVLLPGGSLRSRLNAIDSKDPHRHRNRFTTVAEQFPDLAHAHPSAVPDPYAASDSPIGFHDPCAYSANIFTGMSRRHLLDVFAWSEQVRNLDIYKRLEDKQGTYDIAHLRRGDIASPKYNQNHVQGYSVVSKDSYTRAFRQYGFDPGLIEWVSDDRTGKWHADRPETKRGGWRYPEGSRLVDGVIFDWLEDFLRLYFARTIFRANSSFSWWAAFLSPRARVFGPVLDRRYIYGVDGMEEIDVDFVEGNHPHWMYGGPDIVIPE